MLFKRVLSALALAGGAALILASPTWVWFLFILAVSLRMNHELAVILEAKGHRHARRLSTLFSVLILAATWTTLTIKGANLAAWEQIHPVVMSSQAATLAMAFIGSFCLFLLKDRPRATIGDVSTTFMGIVYVGWLPSFWVLLRVMPGGIGPLLWAIAAAVVSDVGAYFAGRFFGKHPFFPQISPKKTIEGALGGFLLATGILALTGPLVGIPLPHALILGTLLAIGAPAGDLAESLLKRDAGVKDAGDLIPGHGGILDRFDSFLFNGPIAYFYLVSFGLW